MVLNAAVQMLREAEELKQNILKFKSETSMLQERSLWSLQQQLQKIYQKVLVLDLDYALDKKVEQDLWNVGFKQQIEALQTIAKDRKNPLRSEGQAMLSWVLQAAAGFYLCLLHQICTTFKLDLPFRRRASLLGWVEGWSPAAPASPKLPPPAAARYICQHCLVHLGDLARYREQPRVAYTFYRHALVVSPHSGQPYNQLALLARRRGRRLGALYWHVRATMVRAPFPPAPANLRRTLQATAVGTAPPAPALLGGRPRLPAAPPVPRDAHGYVTALIRALHDIHMGERLEAAEQLVETLNSSLTSLVATDSFESMTLIKMMCVIIWLVHTTTDDLTASDESLSESEASAATLSQTLAVGAVLALLLPAHTADSPPTRTLPALKVCLQWAVLHPQLLTTAPFVTRPHVWHALAHALNKLPPGEDKCESVPLPEDEELHGFQPLERSFEKLKFCNHTAWDTYGRRVPDVENEKPLDQDEPKELHDCRPLERSFEKLKFCNHTAWDTYGRRVPDVENEKPLDQDELPPSVVSPECVCSDPALEGRVRARRLRELGARLAELAPDRVSVTTDESGVMSFTALCRGGEELSRQRDDAPPAPVVISEADFREKVRDQRVGILKPQGSLERAREERAMATTDDQDSEESFNSRGADTDDKREARRPRVNIAMAAILRKQEESCKQVKFKTPPPLAEETDTEVTDAAAEPIADRPKTIQPKPHKSLAQLPVGRKTGGILALKDKSGYPHLVDIPPDNTKRKEEKQPEKDPKVIQPPSQKGKWRSEFDQNRQRNYGLQNAGISYNPNYSPQANTNIRLSVVNPKEIDVRSAALQKQNSRGDFSHRQGYMSSDKKQFLNDLPPRFANQRWAQEEENKFRDDDFRIPNVNPLNTTLFSQPPPNWLGMPPLPQMSSVPPLQSPLASQLSLSPMGVGGPRQMPQLGQMTHPTQMNQYPPPLTDYVPQWWKSNIPFNPPTTTQQFYPQMSAPGPSYTQMPSQTQTKPEASSFRQSAIGQMPRHVSPPGYNALGFGYNMFEQFNQPMQQRSYLEENYPPLERHLELPAPFEGFDRREEILENSSSPLDLSMPVEDPIAMGRESPPEDPGTYSLFSGAPGAVTWGNVTQSQQGSPERTPPWALWELFMHHPPLPVEQPAASSPVRSRPRHSSKAVMPPHPYHRPF